MPAASCPAPGVTGRKGFQVGITADPDVDYDLTYAYDAAGRLEKIAGNGLAGRGCGL